MGWERKRGKLDEFNRLLRGATDTSYVVRTGDAAALGARFVLTLDADTVLPRDAARRLVATLAHPLNRAGAVGRRPAGRRRATGCSSRGSASCTRPGCGRGSPGSSPARPASTRTPAPSSDVYQDLFGWGTFTGKGLYDVDAFDATAGRAFPENHILSHDLIESNFARCGLVTDVEVFDDFPAKYHAYAKREHRWVRGDWQLLPWLGRTVPTPDGPAAERARPRSAGGRCSTTCAGASCRRRWWCCSRSAGRSCPGRRGRGRSPRSLVLALPLVLQLLDHAARAGLRGAPARRSCGGPRPSLAATVGQVGADGRLPGEPGGRSRSTRSSGRCTGCSSRAGGCWSGRRRRRPRPGSAPGSEQFVAVDVAGGRCAVALAVLVAWVNPEALPAALPWLAGVAAVAGVAWLVSRPLPDREPPLTDRRPGGAAPHRPQDVAVLRDVRHRRGQLAAAGQLPGRPEGGGRPPHLADEHGAAARSRRCRPTTSATSPCRTSPTALGRTFDTLDRLERYRGHFLNWYETTTLRPLPPAYVSTVDSGNLLGCLLALKNGLIAKARRAGPVARPRSTGCSTRSTWRRSRSRPGPARRAPRPPHGRAGRPARVGRLAGAGGEAGGRSAGRADGDGQALGAGGAPARSGRCARNWPPSARGCRHCGRRSTPPTTAGSRSAGS